MHRRTVLISCDNQIAITFCVIDLAVRLQDKCPVRAIELPRAGVNRAGFDRAGEIINGQSASRQRRRVGLDANGALHAIDVDLRHARQDRNALCDRGGRVLI